MSKYGIQLAYSHMRDNQTTVVATLWLAANAAYAATPL